MKPTVVRTFDSRCGDHRINFQNCPACDKKFDMEVWDQAATRLVLDTVHGKHGSVAIASECPACFEPSWVHHEFHSVARNYANNLPESFRKPAAEEFTRRHVAAVTTFADSLCAKCTHLRRLTCDTLPVVDCTYGKNEKAKLPPGQTFLLHFCFTETKCPAFTARKTP